MFQNLSKSYFDRAITINPVHKEALLLRGYSYHANNEFEKALKDYLLLIETGDVKEGVYMLAGKAYLGLNNSEKACDCFKIASQLNQKIGYKLLSKYCK